MLFSHISYHIPNCPYFGVTSPSKRTGSPTFAGFVPIDIHTCFKIPSLKFMPLFDPLFELLCPYFCYLKVGRYENSLPLMKAEDFYVGTQMQIEETPCICPPSPSPSPDHPIVNIMHHLRHA